MTVEYQIKVPKKLIEVALPLDSINANATKEKGNPFLKGHPRNIHQWWARRPQAIARAIIFAQLINDPSWKWELEHPEDIPPGNLKASWAKTRKRLFAILEQISKWENTENLELFEQARAEILKSWRETCELNKDHPQAERLFNPTKLPPFHDPFAGGGALPLEAQRLGLEVEASDLNPVAVLINKAILEIPPRFAGRAPVNPDSRITRDLVGRYWDGAQGLAEDVRYYGKWMRDEMSKRIGDLYPAIDISAQMARDRPDLQNLVGQRLSPIAWLWARTVKSPNPAFRHADVPLASTFVLSGKEGKQAYVEPIVTGDRYRFEIRMGEPPEKAQNGTKLVRSNFRCLLSGVPIGGDYIKAEGKAGRIGARLMAVVADGPRGRVFLAPTADQESVAEKAHPRWKPEGQLVADPRAFTPTLYGFENWSDLFTARQLVALTTLVDLVPDMLSRVHTDAIAAGVVDDAKQLEANGHGALAYAEAVAIIQALAIDKCADYSNTLCTWNPTNQNVGHLFTKQAIPISWDFVESSAVHGGLTFDAIVAGLARSIESLPAVGAAKAFMHDCASELEINEPRIISTDPPYYDNVPYADLSDFFYVWLRRSLRSILPELFATLSTPKSAELVAFPYRHNGKSGAELFFLNGMTLAMHRLAERAHRAFPVTVYYAFKQSETDITSDTISTGWETFIEAVIRAGFAICGTWPVRTERAARARGIEFNALASSIVLVCRPRAEQAKTVSRREFVRELNKVLPEALDEMTRGTDEDRSPVAPVDLSQAIIGPGMAVFSKYVAVLEADGTTMSVGTALRLINRFLAEDDFDHDTQFCLHWFEQYGWKEGRFGQADTLARAKGTSVDGVKQSGVLYASGGLVRLFKWSEYEAEWQPGENERLPVWEALHRLIQVFRTEGESGAGKVLAAVASKAEPTRQLAYRLYTLCERAGSAEDARAYNEIVTSWSAIESAAAAVPKAQQTDLFG